MRHNTNKKTTKSKSDLFILLLFFGLFISSCSRDVKNLDDLKEISFEENPTLFNGFRLGYQPDSIGFHFRHYYLDNSPRFLNAFCLKCKKWRHKESLRLEEKHSWEFILYNEGFGPFRLRLSNLNDEPEPNIIRTKNPNVYYMKDGYKYTREVNSGDDPSYRDGDGNSFLLEEQEPIIYFEQPEGEGVFEIGLLKSLPEGIYGTVNITGDFGKDTIITDFDITFKSENNTPISRLFFNSDDGILYQKGDIVDFSDEKFEELYGYDCKLSYIAALNQQEVQSIINYFEKKFGKKKYNTRARSGNFNRSNKKSFYREYRWSVGIVNIVLSIDDYPPTNTITSSFDNPYNELTKGYGVHAVFKLNDKVLKIIEKEN
jgi:hypothetical protein